MGGLAPSVPAHRISSLKHQRTQLSAGDQTARACRVQLDRPIHTASQAAFAFANAVRGQGEFGQTRHSQNRWSATHQLQSPMETPQRNGCRITLPNCPWPHAAQPPDATQPKPTRRCRQQPDSPGKLSGRRGGVQSLQGDCEAERSVSSAVRHPGMKSCRAARARPFKRKCRLNSGLHSVAGAGLAFRAAPDMLIAGKCPSVQSDQWLQPIGPMIAQMPQPQESLFDINAKGRLPKSGRGGSNRPAPASSPTV